MSHEKKSTGEMPVPLFLLCQMPSASDRRFGDPQHFLDTGDAFRNFLEAILTKRHHATFNADSTKFSDVGIAGNLVAKEVIEQEHFIEAATTTESGFTTLVAALTFHDFAGIDAM